MLNKMQKQIKEILTRKNFLIENSKYYSYDIGNSSELSKLNFMEGNFLLLL